MIGLFGGTFDPVHIGHLSTAQALKTYLGCHEMRLIPCHIPALNKTPTLNTEQRLQMLQLAISEFPELSIDDCEIQRQQTSYCIDTLQWVRSQVGADVSVCWCMGTDAFHQLPSWHRWQDLLNYAHLVVVERAKIDNLITDKPLQLLVKAHSTDSIEALRQQPNGFIHQCALPPIAISSTLIRQDHTKYKPIFNHRCQSLYSKPPLL